MMAAVAREQQGSPQIEREAATRRFVVVGAADDLEARSAIEAIAPLVTNGLDLIDVPVEHAMRDVWSGEARYGVITGGPPIGGATIFGFDTTGGRQKIFRSLATTPYEGPGGAAIDFKGAINVTDDGVEGVEIVVPSFATTITKWFHNVDVTQTWINTLEEMTGRMNNAPLTGWPRPLGGRAAGEALLLGARGQQRGVNGDFEITFEFAVSRNVVGVTVDEISGIAKGGHSYLWVRYEDRIDDTTKRMVKKPIQVNVERVYEYGDFSLLGLGPVV